MERIQLSNAKKKSSLTFLKKLRLRKFAKNSLATKSIYAIADQILSEIDPHQTEKASDLIRNQKLILNLEQKEIRSDYLRDIRIFRRILKTRGLLRWICFRLFQSEIKKPYQISRINLTLQLLRNWHKFRVKVLNRLQVTDLNLLHDFEIDTYEYTHPHSWMKFNLDTVYLLNEDGKQYYKKSLSNQIENNSLLGQIIIWDSSIAIKLIREVPILSSTHIFLDTLENYPEFKSQLESRKEFSIREIEFSRSNFDELLELKNDRRVQTISNVEIWHQRFIIRDQDWFSCDITTSPFTKFVAGHWQFIDQISKSHSKVAIKIPARDSVLKFDQAIMLLGRADENWYHLVLDTLPRYLFMRDIEVSIPVLIRNDLPETSKDFLVKLISHNIVWVSPRDVVEVKKLYFVSARSTVFDSPPLEPLPEVSFSPNTIKVLRNFVLSKLSIESSSKHSHSIFLPREAKYRMISNQKQITHVLAKYKLRVVPVDQDFFLNQVGIFDAAKLVISPGGAILANMIFMKPGNTIVSIHSSRNLEMQLWRKLALACNLQFEEVIGIPVHYGLNRLARLHSNFYVSRRAIRRKLKGLVV